MTQLPTNRQDTATTANAPSGSPFLLTRATLGKIAPPQTGKSERAPT
jgi:hypothetical protein